MKMYPLVLFLLTAIAISSCSQFSDEVQEDSGSVPAGKIHGKYYRGDGLGVNHYLELAMNGSFVFRWYGCLGEYDKNDGAFRIEGNKLILFPELPNIQKGFQGTPTQFIIRQAGMDIFLLEKRDLREFEKGLKENVNSHKRYYHGLYYRKIIPDTQEDNRYEVGIDASLRIYDKARENLLLFFRSDELLGGHDKLDDDTLFFWSDNDTLLNIITRHNNRASINLDDGKIIRNITGLDFEREAVESALRYLNSPITQRRKTGLIVLGYLKAAESVPVIIKMLDDESYQYTRTSGEYKYEPKPIRIAAIRALAKIQGDKALSLLVKYSKDDDAYTRAAVACSFVDMKHVVSEELLQEFLKDNDPHVRLGTLETIGRIGDKKYRSLIEIFKSDKEEYIRDWAQRILDFWDGKNKGVLILSGDNYPSDD